MPPSPPVPHDAGDIHAVLFDAVGTLFGPRGTIGEIYAEIAARHGVKALSSDIDRRLTEWRTRNPTPSSRARWRDLVLQLFSDEAKFASFGAFFDEVWSVFRSDTGWRLFPETLPILSQIQARLIPMGVVTTFDERIHQVLGDLGIASFFSTVQTPESAGFRKPDPRIFLAAARALRTPPTHILFVGDDPLRDLTGAQGAGMQALLVDRGPQSTGSTFLIRNLTEILPRLGTLPG